MTPGQPVRTRVWRLLRHVLPPGFRERRAEDVLATHVSLVGGSAHARGARFWLRVGWDVVLTGVRLRGDGWRAALRLSERNRRRSRMDVLAQVVAMALRSLRRSPWFAAAVVVILAVGIAANVTMFRVLDRLLLSPPEHIEAPEQVKRLYVHGIWVFSGKVVHSSALSYRDYVAFTEVGGFDEVAGYSGRTLTVDYDGVGEGVRTEFATASYFELLGVRPALGRFYGADEDVLGAANPTAVLSWAYWQGRLGGDRGVLGRVLPIGASAYTVVGVAPRGFTGVGIDAVDVWLPFLPASEAETGGTTWVDAPGWYVMSAVARVTGPAARAEAEATLVHRRQQAARSNPDPNARVVLAPLITARGPNASRESEVARLLAGLTALVLLITCANVGNLYLARVLARRRELAIQTALGVSRTRLFGQLLAEVAVLALAAGVLAWWIGTQAAAALFRVLSPDAALAAGDGLRVLATTVVLALATALLTGVLPALRATRADAADVLRRGTATRRVLLLRRGLLLVQAALSVVLLAGSGLFIRSLQRAQSVDLGLDMSVLAIDVELHGAEDDLGASRSAAVLRMLPTVRESALIETAAAASLPPFSGWYGMTVYTAEGDSVDTAGEGPYLYGVSGGYFETMGIRIVAGRALTDADAAPGAPPAVVMGERLAARLWPGRSAVGRCFRTEQEEASSCTRVVGVAADFLPSITAEAAPLLFYVPQGHPAVGGGGANYILTRPAPGVTAAMVREFVQSGFPELRRVEVAPLSDSIAPALRAWRLGATLLTAVGALALLISAAGLYSMLTFDVVQRRRELGIRAALGASASRLARAAIATNLAVVGAGVAIGVAVALAVGRAVEAMLFRVSASDPAVYVAVCAVMIGAALAAGALPARRVTRTDPAIPLREE
jgi:putative ABC transport system permease protein